MLSTMRLINTYDALGWRTSRAFDDARGAYDGLDQKRVYYYGADWRMLEERVDTDVTTDSDSIGGDDDDTDWVSQQFWGIRYIDDAVGKRVDRSGAGDFVDNPDCTYWYQLTDTQFSVGTVLDSAGYVYERVSYDAYGEANHRYAGDANGDNSVSNTDAGLNGGANTIDLSGYHADLDVNCDGVYDSADVASIFSYTPYSPFPYSGLPGGWISDPSSDIGPDNSIGYAGYVFNHEREDYTVRFRNYYPDLGRWGRRDPIGYINGENLYEYLTSDPTRWIDPLGLEKVDCDALRDLVRRRLAQMKNIYDSLNGGSGNGNSPSSSGLGNSGPSGLNPAMTPAVAGNNIAKEMAKKLGSEAGEKALGAVGAAIDITDAVIGVAGAENSTEATISLTDSIGGASAAAATYGMLGGGIVGATGSAIVGGLYGTGSYIGRTYVGSLVDGYYNRALAQVLTSTLSLSHRQELLKAWHRLGGQASEAATKINECCEGGWQG